MRQRTAIAFHEFERATLWQRGYYERTLRREDDLRAVAAYIVANPLRAGLVVRVEDYPFRFVSWGEDLTAGL